MDPARAALQIFNGLVNGSFYALLSLGLAIIFGMLRVVNFAHGTFYMLGAFGAYILLTVLQVPFWPALILAPLGIAVLGMALERTLIRRLYNVDPLYNFLLTFGVTLVIQDAMRLKYGALGRPYTPPEQLRGVTDIGIALYPTYRLFAIAFALVVCVAVYVVLERTRVGMVVRASTEKPALTRALGVNVDLWVTPVFGFGVALAALGGVLAAPILQVSPLMGADVIIVIFAVVVIGGLGSILGAVVAGFLVGLIASFSQILGGIPALTGLPVLGAFFAGLPRLENALVFVVMAIVLLIRPAGLFGRPEAG